MKYIVITLISLLSCIQLYGMESSNLQKLSIQKSIEDSTKNQKQEIKDAQASTQCFEFFKESEASYKKAQTIKNTIAKDKTQAKRYGSFLNAANLYEDAFINCIYALQHKKVAPYERRGTIILNELESAYDFAYKKNNPLEKNDLVNKINFLKSSFNKNYINKEHDDKLDFASLSEDFKVDFAHLSWLLGIQCTEEISKLSKSSKRGSLTEFLKTHTGQTSHDKEMKAIADKAFMNTVNKADDLNASSKEALYALCSTYHPEEMTDIFKKFKEKCSEKPTLQHTLKKILKK